MSHLHRMSSQPLLTTSAPRGDSIQVRQTSPGQSSAIGHSGGADAQDLNSRISEVAALRALLRVTLSDGIGHKAHGNDAEDQY